MTTDEQKIDGRRTDPRSGENGEGNLTQDNAAEAPGLPLVGGHDRPSGGAGTAGAGPMQGAATGGGGGGNSEGGLAGRIHDALLSPEGDDPTGFLGGAETVLGGNADLPEIGGAGEDGLLGGVSSDGDRSGHVASSDSRSSDEFGTEDGDSVMPDDAGSDDVRYGGDPESRGAEVDEENTPRSGALPDEDLDDDVANDRQITPPTS